MIPSAALLDFLKGWEGSNGYPVLETYIDSAGVATIGFGHTGPDVKLSDRITPIQATAMLQHDLDETAFGVDAAVRIPLAQNQYDALCSFAFNLGVHALAGSTLLRYVNAAQFDAAAAQFPRWDYAGGKENAGLLKRRVAEQHIFADSDYSARP